MMNEAERLAITELIGDASIKSAYTDDQTATALFIVGGALLVALFDLTDAVRDAAKKPTGVKVGPQ